MNMCLHTVPLRLSELSLTFPAQPSVFFSPGDHGGYYTTGTLLFMVINRS